MPDLEAAYKKYGEEIHFIMVNLTDGKSETVQTASAYIAGQGYTFPVYYDTDMSGAMAYKVTSIPITYFIDAQGNIVAYASGMMSASRLQNGINLLLDEA
jgi:thiol-disulfide isomerase/thioredoxin